MSTIHIEVIDVVVEKVGNYKKMTVTHRHAVGGNLKVDAKAVMDFATPPEVWDTLKDAKKGDQFLILREKDKKEGKYWNWVGIERDDGTGVGAEATDSPAPSAPVRKNFAAADAEKQRLIVRQNALTNSVKFHEGDGNGSVEEVLLTAEEFAKWVLEETE